MRKSKSSKSFFSKSLAIILALALIFCMTPAAFSLTISDHAQNDLYFNSGGGSGSGSGSDGDAGDGGDYVPDEVLAPADSLMHAQEIAEAYGLELKSYAWGIAVLAAPTPEVAVIRSMMMRRVDMPQLSLNLIYYPLEYEGYTSDYYNNALAERHKKPREIYNYKSDPPAPHNLPVPPPVYDDPPYIEPKEPEMPPIEIPDVWHHYEVDSFDAWNVSKGENVVIAVIDTGIDIHHPAFAGRISDLSYNSHTDQVGLQHVRDTYGHGTHVSGIAAASIDYETGVYGIAPDAQILVINAFDPSTYTFQEAALVRGINYALANGADIINMSLGRPHFAGADELEQKAIVNAVANGVTIICSAGNGYEPNAAYPAVYPEVIAVSATAYGYRFESDYSNYGPEVDVAAPGSNVYSTDLDGGYSTKSGTSMSAPIVTGIAALIKSLHPEYSPEQVRELICSTARDLGDFGRDDYFGHGIVSAYAAVLGLDALYKVTFDFNDGDRAPVAARVVPGRTLFETYSPLREGYAFGGWYMSDGGLFDFANPVENDFELTASWIEAVPGMYLTEFPDGNFRRAVLQTLYEQDFVRRTESDFIDNDKYLLASITSLDVVLRGIRHMTGLEYFAMLETLICWGNQLTELDVTKNVFLESLDCSFNRLAELNVSKNIFLKSLSCWENQLTELDLSHNTNLESLDCSFNWLTELDVANNTALVELWCGFNSIVALDISKSADLESLYCSINELAALNVTNNTKLENLQCWYNQLTELDVSKNQNLKYLDCDNNQLTELDLSNNPLLEDLLCSNNKLTELDLSNNALLVRLICNSTLITELDLSNNTSLEILWLIDNQLSKLDATNSPLLIELVCGYNKLTSLDMSNNPNLEGLYCYNNKISNLNVSNNTELRALDCDMNYLTGLDVTNNTNLTRLNCTLNYMQSIDDVLGWQDNQALVLDWSFNFYPQISGDPPTGEDITDSFKDVGFLAAVRDMINKPEGPILDYDVANITSLYLEPWYIGYTISDLSGLEHFRALMYLNCAWQQLEKLDLSQNTMLLDLRLTGNQLKELDVSKNTALVELYCENNNLTELDLTNNTALISIDCDYNKLTELDVSINTALELLYCFGNQLTELDVSQNIELRDLYCARNQLTKLDITNNTALWNLDCSGNLLTALDLSQNKELANLYCDGNLLTELDVSQNIELRGLYCSWNQLNKLDIANNTALWNLDCGGNLLTELDVSQNIELRGLYCSGNLLTELDLSQNKKLESLDCSWNQLTALDVSSITLMYWLNCQSNYIASPDDVKGWRELGLQINSLDNLYEGNFFFYEQLVGGPEITFMNAFPDRNFRVIVLRLLNKDGGYRTEDNILSDSDKAVLAAQDNLDVFNRNISDMTGLEYFTGLRRFYCDYNQLTTLDVSRNVGLVTLVCSWNQLTRLDVSNNTALTWLDCNGNYMRSPNSVLGWKEAGLTINSPDNLYSGNFRFYNQQETPITFGEAFPDDNFRAVVLRMLNRTGGNRVDESIISEIDKEILAVQDTLDVFKRNIADMTGLEYFTGLRRLYCDYNQLTTLDVSRNVDLNILVCSYNQLTKLDVSNNLALTWLDCNGNYIASPDYVLSWQELGLAINSPDSLFSGNFWFYNQQEITSGITFGEAFPDANFRAYVLRELNWNDGGNRTDWSFITEKDKVLLARWIVIDVSFMNIADLTGIEYFTGLESLHCYDNLLTKLNLSENIALVNLSCWNNQLRELDVSQNTELWYLSCGDNQLTELDVTQNIDLIALQCWSNQLTSLDVSQNTALTSLLCDDNQLTELNVSQNTNLESLWVSNNQLTELDISQNTGLIQLLCVANQLTRLDLSQNTVLETIWCNENQLKELYLANNVTLDTLACWDNQLADLDVSQNINLKSLFCFDNRLTKLDVTHNTILSELQCYNNYMSSPNDVKGWQELDLIINSPEDLYNGTFRFYNQYQPSKPIITITTQPQDMLFDFEYGDSEARVDGSLTIEAEIYPGGVPQFFWYLIQCDAPDPSVDTLVGTGADYILPDDLGFDSIGGVFQYYCVVFADVPFGEDFVISDVATVYVGFLIIERILHITVQPAAETRVTEGDITESLHIEAVPAFAPPPITYQWYSSADGSVNDITLIPGETGETFFIPPDLTAENSPYYFVCAVYADELGPVMSNVAKVIVEKPMETDLTFAQAFPDPNFLQAVLEMPEWDGNKNGDDIITGSDLAILADIIGIDITGKDIADLTGLEYFAALTHLYVGDNRLTELDLSKNPAIIVLHCYGNQLTDLDISNNPDLENLHISNNLLTGLDVSNNLKLQTLHCWDNYMTSPESVIGWRELGLVINSPEHPTGGTFLYYDQFVPQIVTLALKSIKITSYPEKTLYTPGEALDLTGLVVTAVYSNGNLGSEDEITGYSTEPAEYTILNDPGVQTITISYTEDDVTVTASFDVAVGEDVTLPVLERIIISSEPVKTVYTPGEALDLNGLTVTAIYDDGSEKEVAGYSADPGEGTELNNIGMLNVMVTYFENDVTATAEFFVVVMDKPTPVNKISIQGVELEYRVESGVAILTLTKPQMTAIIMNSGNNIVINLRDYDAADIYIDPSCFKGINKTLTIVTSLGSDIVRTQNIWNNSGKMKLITVRNGSVSVKNV